MMSHVMGVFKHSPDTHAAAKSGTPAMAATRPTIPLSVPAGLAGVGTAPELERRMFPCRPSATPSVLDTKPDARQIPPAAGGTPAADGIAGSHGAASREGAATGNAPEPEPASTVTAQPLPTNHQPIQGKRARSSRRPKRSSNSRNRRSKQRRSKQNKQRNKQAAPQQQRKRSNQSSNPNEPYSVGRSQSARPAHGRTHPSR